SPPQVDSSDDPYMVAMHSRLQEANELYAEEHTEVGQIIMYMAELLNTFVNDGTPENRARFAQELAKARAASSSEITSGGLKYLLQFSIMLEDGLECLGSRIRLLQKKLGAVREHDYVVSSMASGRGPMISTKGRTRYGPPAKIQLVTCDLCPKSVPRLRFANHLRTAHPAEFEEIAKHRCHFCNRARFIKEAALNAHFEICTDRIEQQRELRRFPKGDAFPCQLCHACCKTLKELSEHTQKEHPMCQILTCSSCGVHARSQDEMSTHWKDAGIKDRRSRCVRDAHATLLSKQKLIAQVLTALKQTKAVRDFSYVECLKQKVMCYKCGAVAHSFNQLYFHVHSKHGKTTHAHLTFGCTGCDSKYRCSQALREHLLKCEIEKIEQCRNGGAAYWDGLLLSKSRGVKRVESTPSEVEEEKVDEEEMPDLVQVDHS
ncbi:hypothetical protein PFISCL1PPCAC_23005, partial [Pristionchus fissidentatus]